MITKQEIKTLFEHDQLRSVMRKGEAFSEFVEKDPEFPPTFKFTVGSSEYDHKYVQPIYIFCHVLKIKNRILLENDNL